MGKSQGSATGESLFARLADRVVRIAAESRYVATNPRQAADVNHITRLEIVFNTDPFSETSLQTLQDVRATLRLATAAGQPLEGTNEIGLAGSTSAVSDLKRVTTSDQHRMYVLVTLGIYAVLVALLRRPGISLYLLATVVLGYLASLGLTDLVFHALHRGPGPWEGLDWTVGFFLFVILVAVGEDYNILLMARVIEEERKYGVVEGTRRAVAQTGGIISSCGLIMAGTFGSMLTGSLTSLRELGFALGAGRLARHVPRSPDPGSGLRHSDRPGPMPEPAPRRRTSGGKRSSGRILPSRTEVYHHGNHPHGECRPATLSIDEVAPPLPARIVSDGMPAVSAG